MSKLWDKGDAIDETLARFTVGSDPVLDKALVYFDCLASIAHARMLAATGLLTSEEASLLCAELALIANESDFIITPEQEDCHTAIENRLTDNLGEVGKKIHAARSRNDQVLTALRLYSKQQVLELARLCNTLASALIDFAIAHENVALVGRTHMQKAMPSSLGLWSMAFAESLLDDVQVLKNVYALIDQCPLGSAASFGVNWPIDRTMTAQALGFAKVQNNVLYAANSRGKFEASLLHAMTQVMVDLSKLSADLIFFSIPETGYVVIPSAFCSGSSLMPQKRNPCALELIRAKSAAVSSYLSQTLDIIRTLSSGYNRDFQETKAPLMMGFETTKQSVAVMTQIVKHLEVNKEACLGAFSTEVFATDKVMRLVAEGAAFRDAYREVGTHLADVAYEDPNTNIKLKTHVGATGNLAIAQAQQTLIAAQVWVKSELVKWKSICEQLLVKEIL